jgi:hypothetical protein
MKFGAVVWLLLGAYAIHVLEEFALNWRDWARSILRLPVEWPTFYVTNSVVVVLGIVAGQLGGDQPLFGLSFAALMLINATFFHVLPVIKFGGRFSPGLITAVLLFYPAAIWAYVTASHEGLLSTANLFGSFAIGATLMATPIVLLRIKDKPYFQQG